MGEVYHGSSISGLTKLEPKKSTHGTYVYAAKDKNLAVIFSSRCGDDMTYTLYRNNDNEPWKVVERIPTGFELMFNNSSSIYTLSDENFKDINTGFYELVSDTAVDIIKEEKISNVYDSLKELEQKGFIELHNYPQKPDFIPADDSDLIQKVIDQSGRTGTPLTKSSFKRLLYLHPNLLSKVNDLLAETDQELYDKSELVDLFAEFAVKQILDPSHEQYVKSSFISISNQFPELISQISDVVNVLDSSKQEKINYVVNFMSKKFLGVTEEYTQELKNKYINDDRPFSQIGQEIIEEINNILEESNTKTEESNSVSL